MAHTLPLSRCAPPRISSHLKASSLHYVPPRFFPPENSSPHAGEKKFERFANVLINAPPLTRRSMIRETPGIIIIRIISEPREIINPSQTMIPCYTRKIGRGGGGGN